MTPPDISKKPPELTNPPHLFLPSYYGHVSCICANSVDFGIIQNSTPSFKRHPIWVISGCNLTDMNGSNILKINSYLHNPICDAGAAHPSFRPAIINDMPIMITTPQLTGLPVILTVNPDIKKIELIESAGYWSSFDPFNYSGIDEHHEHVEYEVNFEVKSWKPDGQPAGNIFFTWLCIAEAAICELQM